MVKPAQHESSLAGMGSGSALGSRRKLDSKKNNFPTVPVDDIQPGAGIDLR
jgi:hypothetical protein